MRCDEARELASGWLDGEVPDPRARQVAMHIAECAACQAMTSDLKVLSKELAALGRVPPPAGLESRIRAALTDAQDEAPARVLRFAGWYGAAKYAASMAAVCVLSVFGTWSVLRPLAPEPYAPRDAAAAHMRALLQDSPIQIASSDKHTVRPWFNGKVEFAPPVKDLTAEGFALTGGRLDFVDGHRVATLVYKRRFHTISVFVWPENLSRDAAAMNISGLNLLSWHKDGMVWWAVSDLNPEELRELRALL